MISREKINGIRIIIENDQWKVIKEAKDGVKQFGSQLRELNDIGVVGKKRKRPFKWIPLGKIPTAARGRALSMKSGKRQLPRGFSNFETHGVGFVVRWELWVS